MSSRLWFLLVNRKWLHESATMLRYTCISCLVGLCLNIPQGVTCWFVSEKSDDFFSEVKQPLGRHKRRWKDVVTLRQVSIRMCSSLERLSVGSVANMVQTLLNP